MVVVKLLGNNAYYAFGCPNCYGPGVCHFAFIYCSQAKGLSDYDVRSVIRFIISSTKVREGS